MNTYIVRLVNVQKWADGRREVVHLHAGRFRLLGQQKISGSVDYWLGQFKATLGTGGREGVRDAEESVHQGAIVQLNGAANQGAGGGAGEYRVRVDGGRLTDWGGKGKGEQKKSTGNDES